MAVQPTTAAPRPRRRLAWAALVAGAVVASAAVVILLSLPRESHAPPQATQSVAPALHATPTTLAKVFHSAAPGATIQLAGGDYGTFTGGEKAGTVTIRPEPGALVRIAISFGRVSGVRVEGVTITGAEIRGRARDVTIAASTFTGQIVIVATRMDDAGIRLEGNRLPGIDVCEDCYEGRIHVVGSSGAGSGVVIRENIIGPGGNADGVQVSAQGVEIVDNTFLGIQQDQEPDAPHTDAVQLYGAADTVIRGNFFHDVATAIMAPDGGNHERIEDNVIDTGGYPYAIMLGGDRGSVIRHNTMPELGNCYDGAPCGTLLIGKGPDGTPGKGTIVEDNILGRLSVNDGSQLAADERNLIALDGAGPGDVLGRPNFVGGAAPDARAGFELADGSPGRQAAPGGTDVGAVFAPGR